ncbi:hypothetical protein ABIA48_005290 [Pseudomonas sp. S30_BP2TU TE3576]
MSHQDWEHSSRNDQIIAGQSEAASGETLNSYRTVQHFESIESDYPQPASQEPAGCIKLQLHRRPIFQTLCQKQGESHNYTNYFSSD